MLTPQDEEQRLQDLFGYEILDTLPEKAYDDLAKLAAQICQVPTALISLVDRDRQWFKAKVGIDFNETSRDIAFCAHSILQPDKIFLVPDTTQDARFCNSPLVVDQPKIKFYAGAPLITPQGNALGTLCVIDYCSRTLSVEQMDALASLSRQVVDQLELRRTLRAEQQINQFRSQLITLIAHEFRTPLGVIASSAGILEGYTQKLNAATRHKHYGRIQSAVDQITCLIDKAAQLDRVEMNQVVPTLQVCDLSLFCQETVQKFHQLLGQHTIHLTVPEGDAVTLKTDPYILEQVISNLLMNAVQYSDCNSPVYLALEAHGDGLWLKIEDHGVGIPAADIQRMFQPFIRSENVGNTSGVGLGLTLSKRLADLMGWQITVDSRVDQGSTFSVHIPSGTP